MQPDSLPTWFFVMGEPYAYDLTRGMVIAGVLMVVGTLLYCMVKKGDGDKLWCGDGDKG